ncbi:MAG TPA: hypothetical protein VMW27_12325 [Thermoanaerobaculia bacterium]|nr:hypothetical protein [Thermoanaerobaculia bacterium]
MSALLLRLQRTERSTLGVRLHPGLRPSQTRHIPEIQAMTQGSPIELRFPDGTRQNTRLVTFGISAQRDGETLIYEGDTRDPEIFLFLPEELLDEELPAGTEVWLL